VGPSRFTPERLEEVTDKPTRDGSRTQRPLEETARFLGGFVGESPRPVQIVDAGVRKALEIEVVVPVDDMSAPGEAATPLGEPGGGARRSSIWPSIYPRVLELVLAHRSTIIFTNARRSAERLAAKLNELSRSSTAHRVGWCASTTARSPVSNG
jgi:ATP-dependent Lhr-like helicase